MERDASDRPVRSSELSPVTLHNQASAAAAATATAAGKYSQKHSNILSHQITIQEEERGDKCFRADELPPRENQDDVRG